MWESFDRQGRECHSPCDKVHQLLNYKKNVKVLYKSESLYIANYKQNRELEVRVTFAEKNFPFSLTGLYRET